MAFFMISSGYQSPSAKVATQRRETVGKVLLYECDERVVVHLCAQSLDRLKSRYRCQIHEISIWMQYASIALAYVPWKERRLG